MAGRRQYCDCFSICYKFNRLIVSKQERRALERKMSEMEEEMKV
jgi:hypothetical protein